MRHLTSRVSLTSRGTLGLVCGFALVLALAGCGGKETVATPSTESCADDSVCSPFKCGTDGQCLESCDYDQDCVSGYICAKDKFAIEGRCGTKPSDSRPTATDQ